MNKLSVEEYSHGHFLLAVATEGNVGNLQM